MAEDATLLAYLVPKLTSRGKIRQQMPSRSF